MTLAAVLPIPIPPPDEDRYRASAALWEQAQASFDGPNLHGPDGGSVARYRTGPGDYDSVDQWMGIDIWDAGHHGVENGRQLFVEIPGPPPEGHQGYDFPDTDQIQNRSTVHQALFWSDWVSSTAAQAGGRGSFTGEHVTIARVPPGSTQGYMPTDPGMLQFNTHRDLPGPWDANLFIPPNVPLAATSQ